MVMEVAAGSPAAQAGVVPGDIVIALGDTPASRLSEFSRRLGSDAIGQPVELKVARAGSLVTIGAVVAARPADDR
jgi:S1-C subfamily serine protease